MEDSKDSERQSHRAMRKVTVRFLVGKASTITTGYSGVGHPPNTSALMCQVGVMDHSTPHMAHMWQGEWDAWTEKAVIMPLRQ